MSSLEVTGSLQSIQTDDAGKEISAITNGIKSLSISRTKGRKEFPLNVWKNIAGFLTTQETACVLQLVEKRLSYVLAIQTAPIKLTEGQTGQTRKLTQKLLTLTAESPERPYFADVAKKVQCLNIGKRTVTGVPYLEYWYDDAQLAKILPFFTNLQMLELGTLGRGEVFSLFPPALRTLKIFMTLKDSHLKTLSLHPALNHLIFESVLFESRESFALSPLIHTLELNDCRVERITTWGTSYSNLLDETMDLPIRALKLRFKDGDYLIGKLLDHQCEDKYKVIAKKVTHLNLEGSKISEEQLKQALVFFENIQEVTLPQGM